MDLAVEILEAVSNHPALSRVLIDGSFIGLITLTLYRAERTKHTLSKFLDFVGGKLTVSVKEWVMESDRLMEGRLTSKIEAMEVITEQKINLLEKNIDKKIDDVYKRVDDNHADTIQRDLFAKADAYHDDILLQADKMRAGKLPRHERAKNLYKKVKWYQKFCREHDDYDNGVCEEACEYIEDWYKTNLMRRKDD